MRLLMIYVNTQDGIKQDERRQLLTLAGIAPEDQVAILNLFYLNVTLLQGTVAKKKGAKKDKAAEATYDVSRYAPPIKRHVEELLGAGLSVGDGAATHPQCTQLAMPFPVRGAPHSGDGIVCADCRWASSPS